MFSLLSMNEMKSATQLVAAINADEAERHALVNVEGKRYYHNIHEVTITPDMTFLDEESYHGYTQDNQKIVPEYVWSETSDLFGSTVEVIYGYHNNHVWTFDETVNGWR